VGLIDDDRVVLAEEPVAVDLVEQDAVGHQFDAGVGTNGVGESHLVADEPAERRPEFVGDALGDRARGDAPRLGVADARLTEFEQDLRQLGGLSRAGLAGDDHHLVAAEGGGDVIAALADRQILRIRDHVLRGRVVGGRVGHGCPILPTAPSPSPPGRRDRRRLALPEGSRYSKARATRMRRSP
jgi:hypothetical protein